MNALKPFVCAIIGLSMQQALANSLYFDYRLGAYPEAAIMLKPHAGKDAVADFYLGKMSLYGYGLLRKPDVAMRYFAKAASKGNQDAELLMAQLALYEKNYQQAYHWFKKLADIGHMDAKLYVAAAWQYGLGVNKNPGMAQRFIIEAAKDNNAVGMYALGEIFVNSRNSRNHRLGMIWLEKAADAGNPMAMLKLASCYERGQATRKDPLKAQEWLTKAEQADKANFKLIQQVVNGKASDASLKPEQEAALWLSQGKNLNLDMKPYKLGGILVGWENKRPMRHDIYNQYPDIKGFSRKDLFSPQFELASPDKVPVADYYDALVKSTAALQSNQWSYPSYPFHPMLDTINQGTSYVLKHHRFTRPYRDAYAPAGFSNPLMASFMPSAQEWQQEAAFLLVFNDLYQRAVLGDPSAQFEIGQMFEHGLGVMKSPFQAILYYEKAAAQNHIGAEYNLGIMYLKDNSKPENRQKAMDWLKDAAFKGNRFAQYVLARELREEATTFSEEQSESMLYLAAANGYGEAQYELAERLIREPVSDVSVANLKKRSDFIRSLYQSAAKQGVAQALVPMAFYDAMSSDTSKQNKAFNIAKSQADAGDELAALLLGLMYDRGLGTKVDHDRAIYWYQKSKNNAVSDFILGSYSLLGQNIAKDVDKGTYLLEQASNQKFAWADYNLAVISKQEGKSFLPRLMSAYQDGLSEAGLLLADYYLSAHQDADAMRQAKDIYTSLAEKGDAMAQMKLAYMYAHGIGMAVNEAQAKHWYTLAAKQGNPKAQYQLARFYQIGESGVPNEKLAMHWFKEASDSLPRAANALGFIYETVLDDYPSAKDYYQKAMANGNELAAYNLGLMYEYGKAMPVDYAKAKELYTKAASADVAMAMYRLGEINFYGLNQKPNLAEAVRWYKEAADKGDFAAQYQLGLLYETGVGVKIDDAKARAYYEKASDACYEPAMLAMARLYQYGLGGVAKNIAAAAAIYQKLANQDNHYAQYQLALFHLEGLIDEHSPAKGKALLVAASTNGNKQARQILNWLSAQNEVSSSFIEPVLMNQAELAEDQSADLLYLDAMSEWNRGDAVMSKMILHRIIMQYPNYLPAKRAFEQLNQSGLNHIYGQNKNHIRQQA